MNLAVLEDEDALEYWISMAQYYGYEEILGMPANPSAATYDTLWWTPPELFLVLSVSESNIWNHNIF